MRYAHLAPRHLRTAVSLLEGLTGGALPCGGRLRWRDGTMIRRWVGLALVRGATHFRRIKGHRELATLVTALRKAEASKVAA
jgi:hypothetical protein